MCINCQYLKSYPKGLYCSILEVIIYNKFKNNNCIKNKPNLEIIKIINDNNLCIRKLGYNYKRVCEESEANCNICKKLIIESDLAEV